MMGPETMGLVNSNLVWSDDKVCRNFLCGTCPHTLFTNTVRRSPVFNLHPSPHLPLLLENGPGPVSQIAR